MISARAKQPLARANYLSARKTASRARKLPQRAQNLSQKMFLRSRSNLILALWGREPRQGGLSYDWLFLKRDI